MPGAEEEEPNVLYLDTLLRYYLHADPGGLSDGEWAYTIRYLIDIREREAGENGQRR